MPVKYCHHGLISGLKTAQYLTKVGSLNPWTPSRSSTDNVLDLCYYKKNCLTRSRNRASNSEITSICMKLRIFTRLEASSKPYMDSDFCQNIIIWIWHCIIFWLPSSSLGYSLYIHV